MECRNCDYYRAEQMGETVAPFGYCFVNPPGVLALPQAVVAPKERSRLEVRRVEPEITIQPTTVRPAVRETDFCSKFKLRANAAQ